MLFTENMSRKRIYIYSTLVILVLVFWMIPDAKTDDSEFAELAKVAIRDAGNQLLLANQDSTSLVLPVKELNDNRYQLEFQSQLSIQPDSLVTIAQRSLTKAKLPEQYRVEVKQCEDHEVAYSFEVRFNEEEDIVPCLDRDLPKNCYIIHVRFTSLSVKNTARQIPLYGLALLVVIVLIDIYRTYSRSKETNTIGEHYATLGSYKFYPEQNKLIKEATEINLSKKECELLAIFVANPNQVVKRDELTKRVWEDNVLLLDEA